MKKQSKTIATANPQRAWRKPEARRLDAGLAEGAGGVGNDNVVFS